MASKYFSDPKPTHKIMKQTSVIMSLLLLRYLIRHQNGVLSYLDSSSTSIQQNYSFCIMTAMLMASGIALFIDIWIGPLWKLIILKPRDSSSLKNFRLLGRETLNIFLNRKQYQSTINVRSFFPWPYDTSSSEPDSARRKVNKSRDDNIWGAMILLKNICWFDLNICITWGEKI